MENEYQLIIKNCNKFNIYKKMVNQLKAEALNAEINSEKQIPFLLSIASVESKCNPTKNNDNTGASGLMQLMPVARKEIGMSNLDQFNADNSIKMSIKYINNVIDNYLDNKRFAIKKEKTIWQSAQSNDDKLAWILLSFNKGPGNARKAFYKDSNPMEYGKKYYTEFKRFYEFWNNPDNLNAIIPQKKEITVDDLFDKNPKKEITIDDLFDKNPKKEITIDDLFENENIFLKNKNFLISENILRKMILRALI